MTALFAHDALLVASNAIDIVLKKYGRDLFANAFSQNQPHNAGQPGIQYRHDLQHSIPHVMPLMPSEFGDKIIEAIREVQFHLESLYLISFFIQFPHQNKKFKSFVRHCKLESSLIIVCYKEIWMIYK